MHNIPKAFHHFNQPTLTLFVMSSLFVYCYVNQYQVVKLVFLHYFSPTIHANSYFGSFY